MSCFDCSPSPKENSNKSTKNARFVYADNLYLINFNVDIVESLHLLFAYMNEEKMCYKNLLHHLNSALASDEHLPIFGSNTTQSKLLISISTKRPCYSVISVLADNHKQLLATKNSWKIGRETYGEYKWNSFCKLLRFLQSIFESAEKGNLSYKACTTFSVLFYRLAL